GVELRVFAQEPAGDHPLSERTRGPAVLEERTGLQVSILGLVMHVLPAAREDEHERDCAEQPQPDRCLSPRLSDTEPRPKGAGTGRGVSINAQLRSPREGPGFSGIPPWPGGRNSDPWTRCTKRTGCATRARSG